MTDALARLAVAVRAAREAIAGLRRQNRSLKSRIRQLEEELERRPRRGAGAWHQERERLRRRVEGLVAELDKLLD